MADGITIDTISGSPVASTDDIAGKHFQRVKLALGVDGADDGTVALTNPLPVVLTAANNNVGDVDVASVTPGNAASSLGKTVDNAAGATDTGVAVLAKRVDTPATLTPANGDYTHLQVDSQGNLHVRITAGGSQAQIDDSAFTPGSSEVVVAGFVADEASTDSIDENEQGAARMTLDRKQITAQYVHTTGGWTPYSAISDGTDATNIKASAGQLGWLVVTNLNASPAYIKFYNSASAPTNGSGTPVLRFMIPGDSNGFTVNLGAGAYFDTGIGFTLVTGIADNSSTNVASAEVLVNLGYK